MRLQIGKLRIAVTATFLCVLSMAVAQTRAPQKDDEEYGKLIKQYLQDLGVRSSQIQITSYGKEKSFCIDHSEACWQSNRRAHFVLP